MTASTSPGGAGGVFRGVLGLSSGTVVARSVAALSQVLLAVWLTPTEFGTWAAANSIMAFVSGVTNFGEVNGYLSGRGAIFRVARAVTRRLNVALVGVGLVIVLAYIVGGRPEVALLAAVVALLIPITGESDLLYAAAVKHHFYRNAVISQFAGAAVRLGVAVAIAALTGSAMAFAISLIAMSATSSVILYFTVRSSVSEEVQEQSQGVTPRVRFKWAVNSWMAKIPLQIGFVVAQFVATPYLVGLYYFSFQVTMGISGMVSGPLSKVSLGALAGRSGEARTALAIELSNVLGAGMLVASAIGALALPALMPFLSEEWEPALAATIILLASLPVRLMTPVMDALQQSNDRWWQSTSFSAADAAGTAIAASTLLYGDITILAIALTLWKVLLGIVRSWITLRHASLTSRVGLTVPLLVGTAALVFGGVAGGDNGWIFHCSAILVGLIWLAVYGPRLRRT